MDINIISLSDMLRRVSESPIHPPLETNATFSVNSSSIHWCSRVKWRIYDRSRGDGMGLGSNKPREVHGWPEIELSVVLDVFVGQQVIP